MNKAVPWNVKGIGFDTREAARLAARRAGVPVGEWLDSVIAERAADLGVRVDDANPGRRLEALTARLAELADTGGEPEQAKNDRASSARREPTSDLPPGDTLDDGEEGPSPMIAVHREAQAAPSRARQDRGREMRDAGGLRIDPFAVDTIDRPLATTESRLDPRLDKLSRRNVEAGQIETGVRNIDGRLDRLVSRLEQATDDAGRDRPAVSGGRDSDVTATAVRLRDAIRSISDRQAALEPTATHRASLLTETAYPSIGRAQRETQTPLRAGSVSVRLDGASRQGRRVASEPSRLAPITPDSLDEAFQGLTSRLEARIDRAAGEARDTKAASTAQGTTDIHAEIAALGDRLEKLHRDSNRAQDQARSAQALDDLRGELASLAGSVGDLANRSSTAALADAIRDLAGRVELMRLDGLEAAVLAPVEKLGSDVRELVKAMDPRAALEGLERQFRSLSLKIGGSDPESIDAAGFATLRTEMRDLRAAIEEARQTPAFAARIERELVTLGDRLERVAAAPVTVQTGDLERAVEDIRRLLARTTPDGLLERLDTRMDEFTHRVEDAMLRHAPRADMLHALSRQLDDTHQNLASKVDHLHTTSSDLRTLDSLIRGLMLQIEEARHPAADARALDALEMHVGRLAERLDRSDANTDALTAIERMIGELFQQLEDTRNVALDAAENAARTAAQDTLRAAINSPILGGERSGSVDHVAQELAAFRKAQDASEKRVNATLSALSTTLERLVDRMIVDMQTPKAAAATPMLPKAAAIEAPAQASDERAQADAAHDEFWSRAAGADQGLLKAPTDGDADIPAIRRKAPAVEIERAPLVDHSPDVAPLIAAARRAAQAAQASASAAAVRPKAEPARDVPSNAATPRAFFSQKRRPMLLGLAGVVLLLGALQIAKLSNVFRSGSPAETTSPVASDLPTKKSELSTNATAAASPADDSAAPVAADSTATVAPPPSIAPAQAAAAQPMAAPAPIIAADPLPAAIPAGLRDLATRGDAGAQYEVAVRMADGRGVTRDLKSAAVWFEKAAKQGLAPAQYRLGSMYEKGIGVSTDTAQALTWYERAATQGNSRAMHNLAVMSAEGNGGKPDYPKAATWFSKAADHGVRDSQFNLAILYARGLGVPQSLAKSYSWFSLAANQGDADAGRKRDEIAGKLDAKSLADAKTFVDGFKPAASDRAANDVQPPPGGWDAAAPAKTTPSAARDPKTPARNT